MGREIWVFFLGELFSGGFQGGCFGAVPGRLFWSCVLKGLFLGGFSELFFGRAVSETLFLRIYFLEGVLGLFLVGCFVAGVPGGGGKNKH